MGLSVNKIFHESNQDPLYLFLDPIFLDPTYIFFINWYDWSYLMILNKQLLHKSSYTNDITQITKILQK